jgi:hypothetical protein
MYIHYDKGWSFYKELDEVDNMAVRYWTGTPFGPDSRAGALWASYFDSEKWSLEASFIFAAQGENSDAAIFDTPAYRPTHEQADKVVPPTGVPAFTYTATLLGKWSPYNWLSLSAQPGYRIINNYRHNSGKTVHGFEFVLSVRLRPPFPLKIKSP